MLLRIIRSTVFHALLMVAGLLLSATPSCAQTIKLAPARVMSDEVATIRVSGLSPNAVVVLHAALEEGAGEPWGSEAQFQADAAGVVDTSHTAPQKGSYRSVSAMGLVWSMMPKAISGNK